VFRVLALALLLAVITAACVSYIIWRVKFGFPPPGIPRVLAYHKVTRFELGGTWVPPSRFVSQIDMLLDAGFTFIDEDAYLSTVAGERAGSGGEVLLTFDDGYRELLDVAVPALEERRIPALIFIVSSFVGKENEWELRLPGRRFMHMDWSEIIDLAGKGFALGSHTATHQDLTRLVPDDLRRELSDSRGELEDRVGCVVQSLSYPFGRTNEFVEAAVARAGYRAAFSMYPAGRNAEIDRFALRREGVYIIDTAACLKRKLTPGPLYWMEDLKGRAINGVAVLTPLLKGGRSLGG
jgi:peptidoglycan/xylan/chitin deacetylase (PgdA/CDA1 family)